MAFLTYEWNNLERSVHHIQESLRLAALFSETPIDLLHFLTGLMQALVTHAEGRTEEAIQNLTRLLTETPVTPYAEELQFYLYQEGLYWLVHLSLLLGDTATAQEWIEDVANPCARFTTLLTDQSLLSDSDMSSSQVQGVQTALERQGQKRALPLSLCEKREVLLARLRLTQGDAEGALQLLNSLLPTAQTEGRGRTSLQIKLLLAQAYAACNQQDEARRWLLEGLEQGYLGGFTRIFLDEGRRLLLLIHDLFPNIRRQSLRSYAQKLLQAYAQAQSERSIPPDDSRNGALLLDPLSKQELRVLRLLTTGRSNQEIAQELVVSVNTVRSQVQSIYRKLQVNDRRAAGEVARRLRLL